jgi:hypothetical protein
MRAIRDAYGLPAPLRHDHGARHRERVGEQGEDHLLRFLHRPAQPHGAKQDAADTGNCVRARSDSEHTFYHTGESSGTKIRSCAITRWEGGFLADWPVEVCGTSARKSLRGHILQRSALRLVRTGGYAASRSAVSRTRSTYTRAPEKAPKSRLATGRTPSTGLTTFHRCPYSALAGRKGRRGGNRQRTAGTPEIT